MIIHQKETPTNEQMREMAMQKVSHLPKTPGHQGDYLNSVLEEFLKLQCFYFPEFCRDTREANQLRNKELEDYGYKSPTRYIAGKTYEGSSGWSKDGNFKEKWIISNQLKYFMEHVHKGFWEDDNKKVRDSFMKGVIRGDNPEELLDKVFKHYGSNVETPVETAIV